MNKSSLKKWQKPELTILVRNKPQENVLGVCKRTGAGGPDIASGQTGQCYVSAGVKCKS